MPGKEEMDVKREADLFDRIARADFGRGDALSEAALLDMLVKDESARKTFGEIDAIWSMLASVGASAVDEKPSALGRAGARFPVRAWGSALAACLLLALGLTVASQFAKAPQGYTIDTGRAERRIARLVDGSTVELSADSSVTVQYDGKARRIELTRGEALFKVAHDVRRPFVVDAGDGHIRAVGTAFNVRLGRKDVIVTVVDGTVRVTAEPDVKKAGRVAALTEYVRRGEQVSYASGPEGLAGKGVAGVMSVPKLVDVEGETSWTRGLLEFHGEPLSDVVEEINHHSSKHIVLIDSRFSKVKIYGLLRADDPEGLLALLGGSDAFNDRPVSEIVRIENAND